MRLVMAALACGLAFCAAIFAPSSTIASDKAAAISGIVKDEDGRPLKGVTAEVCGIERQLEGRWSQNHTPHCLMPRVTLDRDGQFHVARDFAIGADEGGLRINLWFEKEGFAPTYRGGISPGRQGARVVMKRGHEVSGTVKRLVQGELQPVAGAAVEARCLAGDLEHQRVVFQDPFFFVRSCPQGDDLPFRQRTFTGSFGEYAFRLSAPPEGKQWFVVCLDEAARIDFAEPRPAKGPDFTVDVQIAHKH